MIANLSMHNSPYLDYQNLRNQGKLLYTEFNGHEGWFVTGYEQAIAILRDPRFKAAVASPKTALAKVQKEMVLYKNGADHTRLRSIIMSAFSKELVVHIEPFIEETADLLLHHIHDKQEIELISDYAFPFSATVIARILGVEIDSYDDLRRWSNLLVQTIDFSRNQTNLRLGRQALIEIQTFFQPILEERLQHPNDDVITKLAQQAENGECSFPELLANCMLLLIAGQETTVNLISNGALLLMQHREQLQLLREKPSLINNAIEEILRFESPTQLTARVVNEHVAFYGENIRKGDRVYLLIGAVNRDPEQFNDAHEFNITRVQNRHLAFGYGEHFCLGASLARMEGKIAIQRLFEKLPHLQIIDKQIKWRNLHGFRALAELNCATLEKQDLSYPDLL